MQHAHLNPSYNRAYTHTWMHACTRSCNNGTASWLFSGGDGGSEKPIGQELMELFKGCWVIFWNLALFLAFADILHRCVPCCYAQSMHDCDGEKSLWGVHAWHVC